MDLRERLRDTDEILLHYVPLHSLLADWGKDLESHLSEWIINNPEKYQDALRQSFAAGCDFACTMTQSSSPWRAEPFGLRDRIHELNWRSAKLANEVTPPGRYVLAIVSTTNPDFLEPLGNMTYDEVYEGYKEQISALLEGGIDVFLIVGNHIDEALIAIEVARDLCDVPIISQNIFYSTKNGFRTMMGDDPIKASAKLEEVGVDVIGGSCGLMTKSLDTSEWYSAATTLIKEMRKGCRGPLSIQPDAGLAQLVDGKTVYPVSPEEMVDEVKAWVDAGARIVGGCCGTSLEHYRKISAAT
ncbi:MAG: homocysteine S-methyltransferase family protein [Dehalococcoidales bacterium]|jgi:5-methyltetrahydrofolate--homocysteine methyltransferase|nr:homocysteine S-methyltransferase family protein [Dehalococcoidales bacterium]